jgi:conserved hypothetical protein TIGR00051
MSAASSPFDWKIRVYYEDTDTGGVVFYANYLKFFERARTEWLRSFGFQQQHLAETTGAIFVVKNTSVDYLSPARLDDELRLTVVVEKFEMPPCNSSRRPGACRRGTAQVAQAPMAAHRVCWHEAASP